MTTLLVSSPEIPRLADLLERLGGISPERVRFYPLPGTATVADVVEIEAHEDRLCELVDGVLVEKPMSYRESMLAGAILAALRLFVVPRKLGLVTGEAGMMQLFEGLVRIPDVAFVSRKRLPGGHVPRDPVPQIVPDLAVEVLSPTRGRGRGNPAPTGGNTPAEMKRKRREYFDAGVRLLWLFDLKARAVTVFTAVDQSATLTDADTLDGGEVLPGFTLRLSALFAELDD